MSKRDQAIDRVPDSRQKIVLGGKYY